MSAVDDQGLVEGDPPVDLAAVLRPGEAGPRGEVIDDAVSHEVELALRVEPGLVDKPGSGSGAVQGELSRQGVRYL